jgi:glycerate 2-kinase
MSAVDDDAAESSMDDPATESSMDDPATESSMDDPAAESSMDDPAAESSMDDTPRRVGGRVLVAPDSFKGTASAHVVADAMTRAVDAAGWESVTCPVSDGGEGFADVLAVLGGEGRRVTVSGPLGTPVEATWRSVGDLAVVESAQASGLVLAGGATANEPLASTTRGTGELIVAARRAGASRILVGLGGSATTDGGLGAVEVIEDDGGLHGATVEVAYDTDTRFTAAARVFAPQKGATPAQVRLLATRLADLAHRYQHRYGVDVDALPGSGAAGGLAGGLAALGARLVPGFDLVARTLDLGSKAQRATLLVTGEGRLDATSWTGKVVGGMAGLATRVGVPLLVVAGSADPGPHPPVWRVVDLSDRFGAERAMGQTAWCVEAAVTDVLRPLTY